MQYGGRIIILISLDPWENRHPMIGSFILLHSGRQRSCRNRFRAVRAGIRCCVWLKVCVWLQKVCCFFCHCLGWFKGLGHFLVPGATVCRCVRDPVCVCVRVSVWLLFPVSVWSLCWQIAKHRPQNPYTRLQMAAQILRLETIFLLYFCVCFTSAFFMKPLRIPLICTRESGWREEVTVCLLPGGGISLHRLTDKFRSANCTDAQPMVGSEPRESCPLL